MVREAAVAEDAFEGCLVVSVALSAVAGSLVGCGPVLVVGHRVCSR